ncbi:unnamed protein product [Psylliodes chrysocephalus]|uniref:Uncharacterized protein n=1 Tax=Psylliodes chrysocephalus TaxID=3402493 RepID=A0A9P0D0D7_9CUCU|nr:unnamed protein product [Psylliodes chrysocephala]
MQKSVVLILFDYSLRFRQPLPGNPFLKKKKCENDIDLSRQPLDSSIPDKKKDTLRHLIKEHFDEEWESREDLFWYKNLLEGPDAITIKEDETGEVVNEMCDCLHEESAIYF